MYCRPQVEFYLDYVLDFREGHWPKSPDGSNYTDPAIRSKFIQIPSKAAEDFAAEMDIRLSACGFAGLAMEAYHRELLTIRQLAAYHHCNDAEIERLIWKALNYCSGFRRRKTSFTDFLSRK